MDFFAFLLSLIVQIHSSRGLPAEADAARLQGVAQDIWTEASERPIFAGDAGDRATALALAAVAAHESGFWSKVQDCTACFIGSQWCDRGRSISIYQLREGTTGWGAYDRQDICQDNGIATQLAARLLYKFRRASSTVRMFDGYARGGIGLQPGRAATEMDAIFGTMAKKAGVVVRFDGKRLVANGR